MPKEFRMDLEHMRQVFERGVRDAKAENERLGIVERDVSADYMADESGAAEVPKVAESDSETE